MAIEGGATDCPYCNVQGCQHLVYDIDETFEEVFDGMFCGLEEEARSIIHKAILHFLRALRDKTDKAKAKARERVSPELLHSLIPLGLDPEDEISDSLLEDDDYDFNLYLRDVLDAVSDFSESYEELGGPGQSSSCMRYYAKNGEKCAKKVLTRMRSDAAALRRLARECRAKKK